MRLERVIKFQNKLSELGIVEVSLFMWSLCLIYDSVLS